MSEAVVFNQSGADLSFIKDRSVSLIFTGPPFFDDFTDISELFGFVEPTKSKSTTDTHKSLMDAIESLINGIDQQISNIKSENPEADPDASNEQDSGDENDSTQEEPTSGFYFNNEDFGDGFHNNDDVDEDDMDKTDDLKPPF